MNCGGGHACGCGDRRSNGVSNAESIHIEHHTAFRGDTPVGPDAVYAGGRPGDQLAPGRGDGPAFDFDRSRASNSLSQLINQFDLYGERWSAPSAELIEQMKRAIKVVPSPGHDPIFTLRFEYPNRTSSQRVTQKLLSRMMDADLRLAIAEADSGSRTRCGF